MIRIKGVNKYFGNTQVLKNINVEINKGEIFGLVGHSGSWKINTTKMYKWIRKL